MSHIRVIHLGCLPGLLHSLPHVVFSTLLRSLLLLSGLGWPTSRIIHLVGHIANAPLDPVLLHISMSLLIPAIPIILLFLFLLILIILLAPFIDKSSLGPVLVVQMLETLVVDPHLEHLPMLYYVQAVVSNVEGILEGCAELLRLEDDLPVLVDTLLAAQVAADHLDCHHDAVQTELPNKLNLCPNDIKLI